ncbi:BREX-2 system adenine-specific DNA-methyltransferase PglX [Nocardiopsis changdeensis]|uniref:site-specific DNA-methyltransferase (adenine-specific) n=1 Tax=Nocardiopsis changdeensis TaxID=2831969 RepID=A0ABX8BFG5_9ACTN|nr:MULTISPECIES: BREX-2 system adenine-specific DNA-methyltransferase PglX [Nocardiopsis]QUX20975.1 BREX-2 system adenine-specific DNA-methyltransferase PglX [Nocardiopsis changdeensis]QYX36906.1 BREX-2 system adenine-specific DNA-methyltransferase PglX [Nocardiopsis sp. MT53]
MNETLSLGPLRRLVGIVREGLRPAPTATGATERDTEHAAVLWVLATAFVAFCEDIGLVEHTSLTRTDVPADLPTASPLQVIERSMNEAVEAHPVLGEVFHGAGTWREHRPDEATARHLVAFWRNGKRAPLGSVPIPSATGAGPDTTLFEILYQNLSEDSRKAYALQSTPDFVIDLVLDRSLGRALKETDSVTEHGLRYIDPACGSGGFLLNAFRRVLERIREERPDLPGGEAIALALACVHGCDLSPIAVMVSRFRLAVEVLGQARNASPEAEREWRLLVAEADSLLEGPGAPVVLGWPWAGNGDLALLNLTTGANILRRSSYDAVATNPPYIVPGDQDATKAYREGYRSARSGAFTLNAPFTECAFSLARSGGYVGLLTASAFAKREFGRPLVERFLPTVQISDIIDTSGAYIPGHGIPTLILTGRNREPSPGSRVTVVNCERGEPSAPDDPGQGRVWTSLKERLAKVPSEDAWTSSHERPQDDFRTHPWLLSPPRTEAVFRSLRSDTLLSDHVHRIGYIASTGADELFSASPASMRRWEVEAEATIDLVTGSEVRDWQVRSDLKAFFPRTWEERTKLVDLRDLPGHLRRLWPYQRVLANRSRINPKKWYDWHQLTTNRNVSSWSIIFPWVATHTHFALNRDVNAPLNSAPVIELPTSITEETALALLGVLNSSTVCFWMKQVSRSKGNPRGDQLRSGEGWEAIYEFTSSRMRELPLPALTEAEIPRELDSLARELLTLRAEVEDAGTPPTGERIAVLGREWRSILGRMVLLQEELDWRVYESYGIVPTGSIPHVPLDSLPEGIVQGERAFEFALAREQDEAPEAFEESEWFARNAISRSTTPPAHWPSDYRRVVLARIDALRNDPALRVLERPDFKHRWATPPWESVWRPAVAAWLLQRCESRELWYTLGTDGVERPTVRPLSELIGALENDPDVIAAVETHSPGSTVRKVLAALLAEEHVPFLAALRFRASGLRKHREWTRLWDLQWRWENPPPSGDTADADPSGAPSPPKFTAADFLRKSYWANRGKFDMPNERFTSYSPDPSPGLSPTSMLGWAGWDARDRAWALVDIVERNLATPQAPTQTVVPLLAGLAEILPWVDRVGAGIGPRRSHRDGVELRRRFAEYLNRLELTEEQVSAWAPPPPRRGRPPKRTES